MEVPLKSIIYTHSVSLASRCCAGKGLSQGKQNCSAVRNVRIWKFQHLGTQTFNGDSKLFVGLFGNSKGFSNVAPRILMSLNR
jgi:hypothetical protein